MLSEKEVLSLNIKARKEALEVVLLQDTEDSPIDSFFRNIKHFVAFRLNKGFFDPYFDNLTPYQLLFEFHRLRIESDKEGEVRNLNVQKEQELIKDEGFELDELFKP